MTIYDFNVLTAQGKRISLSDYKNRPLLIVNTASKCGFTPQYEELEALYQKYKERGFLVLAFPCNQFHEQEPGADSSIQEFCRTTYGVTFPVFSKIEVNGPGAEPLYAWLTDQTQFQGFHKEHPLGGKLDEILSGEDPDYRNSGSIKWNFTKFLIDRKGGIAARFEPTAPMSQVEEALLRVLEEEKEETVLPVTNESGYFEIRLESIGGLGANLCGKLLGELGAVYLGLNSASFSSYGSEKRGSPVKAFIRWCKPDMDIRVNSPVETPHILGLFHEAMAGKLPVTAGVDENTKVVMNTDAPPEQIREKLKLYAGEVFCVDALKIAMESKSRINMVMLGAIAKASGFIPLDAVLRLVEDTIGKKYPSLLKNNREGVIRGYETAVGKRFSPDGKYERVPYQEVKNQWGYENAPIGGVNPRRGSTVSNDLSASREGYLPLFIQDRCINCGLCDTTCPDMVFQFKPGEYKGKPAMVNSGLDYHHCKGCLRCVDVCPTNALVSGLEREHPNPEWFVRNQDLIVSHLEFEDAGANPWITSESYLEERRMDGGII